MLLQLKAQTEGIGNASAPTLTIAQDTIRAYIFAQGIEAQEPWDGIISISEDIAYVDSVLALYGITDGVSVEVNVPIFDALSQAVPAITPSLNLYGVRDTVVLKFEYGDHIIRMGMGQRAGLGKMFAPLTV